MFELLKYFSSDNISSLSFFSNIQDSWIELINTLIDVGVHVCLIGSLFGFMLYIIGLNKFKHSLEVGFLIHIFIRLIGGVLVGV